MGGHRRFRVRLRDGSERVAYAPDRAHVERAEGDEAVDVTDLDAIDELVEAYQRVRALEDVAIAEGLELAAPLAEARAAYRAALARLRAPASDARGSVRGDATTTEGA